MENTEENKSLRLSAGSYDLNRFLHGGYEKGVITTLYGAAGTGKTNFCLQAAVSLANKGKKVIFVDTEGGFSSERVKQLLHLKSGNGEKKDFERVLENIMIFKPVNFREQKDVFDKLNKYLEKHADMLVVDGMTMLYRLDFADAREKDNGNVEEIQKVNSELTKQMRILAEIARMKDIPIIVTNQVYNWDNQTRMVGGDIIKYWSKCLIELINENGRRTAFLRKHRSLPEKRLDFRIVDEGIKKRGWI